MLLFLVGLAIIFLIIFFRINYRHPSDEVWRRFLQSRRRQRYPEEGIDPHFQFDEPPGEEKKNKPREGSPD